MKVEFNFYKWQLWSVLLLISILGISVFVIGTWDNTKKVWHDGADVKITVDIGNGDEAFDANTVAQYLYNEISGSAEPGPTEPGTTPPAALDCSVCGGTAACWDVRYDDADGCGIRKWELCTPAGWKLTGEESTWATCP